MNELDRLRRENADLRERLESAEAHRQRMETLVRTSPVGVLVVDAKTRTIVLVNDEAERIIARPPALGSKLERYDAVTLYRRTDGREYSHEERPLSRSLDRGETVRAEEILFDRPDGETAVVLINTTPIYSEDGRIESAVAVIQDLTPMQELERQRSEFLGMVSHELRVPLAAIKGSAAAVLSASIPFDDAESRQFFRIIDQQADRMRDLINSLLDITRIEAGIFSVSPEPLEIAYLVDEARNTFLRGGGRNEVKLEIAPDMPPAQADARRVSQALNNLLSNASKNSPDSSTIRVSARPTPDRLFAAISVADEGVGIAINQLPHVFKKFSCAGSGDERDHTGLGLAICKGIVEAHGGRIWVESAGRGRGSRFTFTIPLAKESLGAAALEPVLRAPSTSAVECPIRVLAVDDDPHTLKYVRSALSKSGYRVRGTGDPECVIELLESERPELILLDVLLPGMSGFDLIERVRAVSPVPVIFLSGRDEEDNIVKALKLGADDYIVKPFSPPELLARIDASLRKRARQTQSVARQLYRLGDLAIDYQRREVTLAGRPAPLTATEYKLLSALSSNAGRVLTHDQLLQLVWGHDDRNGTSLTRNIVRSLRHKLNDNARRPKYIFTQTGVGYRMAKPLNGE